MTLNQSSSGKYQVSMLLDFILLTDTDLIAAVALHTHYPVTT